MKHLFLGIDLGTSAMKLVLMDEEKKVVASRTEEYESAFLEQGFYEIDPDIWFTCMKAGIRKLLQEEDGSLIRSIGVTGQMHTLVTVDEEGKPVRPAIMWNDTRTKDLVPELKRRIKQFEEGEYLSRTISTGSPAANLYWMSRHEKELFARIHKFMIGPDYLVYRLTGHFGTDYCEASTSCLYLLKGQRWSEEMKTLIGLQENMYPEVRGSAVAAGRILKEFALELGISEEAEVLTGTGDNPATAISAGCLGGGYPLISLGTSGVLIMPTKSLESDRKGKKILFSFDGKEVSYLVQGAVQSNGSTVDWWFRRILGKEDFSGIDKMLAGERQIESRLIFFPHLYGDKTVYSDPQLRGAFIGINGEISAADLTYAVIEGLCFAFKELAEDMEFSYKEFRSLKVIGGGSKSRIWMQTLANVLDMPVEQMDGMMGAGYGMALLAAYHSGDIDAIEHITENTIQVKHRFEPQKQYAGIYREKYQTYLRIYKGMKYIYGEAELL